MRAGHATASADEAQAASEAALAALESGLCGELEASATATCARRRRALSLCVTGDCALFQLYVRGLPENIQGIPVLPRGGKSGRIAGSFERGVMCITYTIVRGERAR